MKKIVTMKFIIFFIVLATIFHKSVFCSDIEVDRLNADEETQVIELIKKVIKIGGLEIDIPIPDPLEFNSAEINLPGEIFNAKVNISKGSLSGLSDLHVLDLDISLTQPIIRFNILMPLLQLHADHYELDGNIYYAVPMKGKGVAHFEIYNLQFSGKLHLKQTINSILLDKLEDAEFSVERIVSRTEFDHNIDEIISALVEDLLADYLNRFSKFITATYSDVLVQYINDILLMLESS